MQVFAVAVDEVVFPQLAQLVHGIADDAEHMGAVADGFQAGKDAEGEEHEHQHHGQFHLTAQAGQACRQGQPSTTLAIYTQVYDKRRKEIRSQMSKELYE